MPTTSTTVVISSMAEVIKTIPISLLINKKKNQSIVLLYMRDLFGLSHKVKFNPTFLSNKMNTYGAIMALAGALLIGAWFNHVDN